MKYWAVAALLAWSLVGCTQGSSSKGDAFRPGGTSDTGGGNGAENRAYEAYIVKVENLPAYKRFIEPKVARLVALSPAPSETLPVLRRWLLYKTWYIAPVSLDTISRDVIGVSFSQDRTEQLAIQTKKSVWINSSRFSRMTEQDQATLMVHEMVMSLYYLKFKSWGDICTEKIYPDIRCRPTDIDVLNEIFPGTPPRPFDADDYENIRAVTGIFLNDMPTSSAKEIDDLLIGNGFDRRFTFGLGLDGEQQEASVIFRQGDKMTADQLKQMVESSRLLNQLPDECRGVRFAEKFPCSFSVVDAMTSVHGLDMPILRVRLETGGRVSPAVTDGMVVKISDVTGSSIEYVQQKRKIAYFLLMPVVPTPLVVGTAFRSLVLVTMEDLSARDPQRVLLGAFSLPGVVTGVKPGSTEGCAYAKPSATSIVNDVLIAGSVHLGDFERNLLRGRASTMPAFTLCNL